MGREQLSQLRVSGRRTSKDQSVAEGGNEASFSGIAEIDGIDSLDSPPFAKPAKGGPPALTLRKLTKAIRDLQNKNMKMRVNGAAIAATRFKKKDE